MKTPGNCRTLGKRKAALRMPQAVCLVALWVLTLPAVGQGATADQSVSRGQAIAQQKCAACHGADGQAPNPEFPKLAGQLREFLDLQLRNYKSGERPHPVMAVIAKGLAPGEIADVAAYYSSVTPMRASAATRPALLGAGERVFRKGKPGAPACQYCHGAQGEGLAPVFPRLAGQHARFIVAALEPYRKVDDFRNPYAYVMKAVVQSLDDADITAAASYIESMQQRPGARAEEPRR